MRISDWSSDVCCSDLKDVAGTPLRLLCPPGKLHLTPFGVEVADFSLRYLADYFDLPYPGDSMDLVAIPDFAFGAMENLGCVTFRETLLLADPEHSTQDRKSTRLNSSH